MDNESRGRKLGEKGAKGEEEIILRSHFSVFRFMAKVQGGREERE